MIIKNVQSTVKKVVKKITRGFPRKKIEKIIIKRPFVSFFTALLILLLAIVSGSLISRLGQKEEVISHPEKEVSIYQIGNSPRTALQAQVEKKGTVQILSQTQAVIQSIYVTEGKDVYKGQQLISLSSNYQGGNAPALQAQLAGAQYHNVKETYDTQKELIEKQRSVANESSENTEELRKINESSLNETKDLLSLNESLLSDLNNAITTIENSPNPDKNQLTTLQTQKASLQSGVDQLRSAVRNSEYAVNTDNPPTTLSNLQKDITLKQLDLQEKALSLSKDVSRIQYNLALVQAGMMAPSAPFSGTIERVHAHIGDLVNPGDVLFTLSSNSLESVAIVKAPKEVAQSVSRIEPSTFTIDGKTVSLIPTYVSSVATDGQLYSIIYSLPKDASDKLTDKQFISVSIPVSNEQTTSVIPFIPIDSVYESQDESTVYVLKNGKAVSQKVTLGSLYGSYVQITKGLDEGDQVILDRNVVAGDIVKKR